MANKQSATLSVQGGPNNGTTISLSEGPVLMGRGVDNDVDLYDETVSCRHALIMETEDGYVVRDLNSLNGTFVGSSKVEASERVLSHGDKVHLADSEINFVFRVRGAVRTDRTDEASSSGGSVELGGRLVQRARRLVHQLAEVGPATTRASVATGARTRYRRRTPSCSDSWSHARARSSRKRRSPGTCGRSRAPARCRTARSSRRWDGYAPR
jgi:hypothetical protein